MIIATFNVNGVTRRLARLLDWLKRESPDIVCLQELKTPDEGFPIVPIRAAGYGALWHGQRSWNGVAILAKGTDRHPDERIYTFWDYFRNHWQRNAGLRIDHLLLSSELAPRLRAANVHTWVRGEPGASDHAPVWIELSAARQAKSSKKVRPKKR